MKDALMMAVQITPEEREAFKNLARSKGMLMQGYMAQLVRRELRDSTATDLESIIPHDSASSGIRDSLQS